MLKGVPIDNLVLIELDLEEQMSKGGIIMTSSNTELERRQMGKETGVIIAMGPHAFEGMIAPIPSIGNRVMFKRYAGTDATLENESAQDRRPVLKQRVMQDKDIYMIIDSIDEVSSDAN